MKGRWNAQIVSVWALLASCAGVARTAGEETQHATARRGMAHYPCINADFQKNAMPTVCHANGGIFVIGLPLYHNWERGSRILISQEQELIGRTNVGIAWVVEAHEAAAEINVIVQRETLSVEGGAASLPGAGQRLRFGHHYARLGSREKREVTLDIGENDGVGVGDYYEARNETRPDYPVGLVRVDRVHAMSADAVVVEEKEPLGAQHEFVLRSRTLPPPIDVAVVPVKPEGAARSNLEAAKRERESGVPALLNRARAATDDLALQVHEFLPEPMGDPATLLERVAARARARRAGQVVWTGGPCAAEPCPPVQFAVVPGDPKEKLVPKPLVVPSKIGGDAADDIPAILGQIAYAGAAYEEASYRLREWAGGKDVELTTDVLLQLVDAEVSLGQLGRARLWLRIAEQANGGSLEPLSYYRARIRIACSNENQSELERLSDETRGRPLLRKATLDVIECAIGINLRAGNEATAQDLLDRGQALARELADHESLARLAGWEVELRDRSGKFDENHEALQVAYKQAVAGGDQAGQASHSLALAHNRSRSGDLDGALRYVGRAVELYKKMRDESGFVACLPLYVRLWRASQGVDGARERLIAERVAVKQRKWKRAELGLRIGRIYLDLQAGKLPRVGKELARLLVEARSKKYAEEELQLLELQVEHALIAGQMQQAKNALEPYKRRASELRREPEKGRAYLLAGRFALQEGDASLAVVQAQKAVENRRVGGDEFGMATGELLLGDALSELKKLDEARRHYLSAESKYEHLHDQDGIHLAKLGRLALDLEQGDKGDALRSQLSSIVDFFQRTGKPHDRLRARLQFEWANFLHTGDHAATLRRFKGLRDEARRNSFAALRAEAQLLIACVHFVDRAHRTAALEFRLARDLYVTMGRHGQQFVCPAAQTSGLTADEGRHARR